MYDPSNNPIQEVIREFENEKRINIPSIQTGIGSPISDAQNDHESQSNQSKKSNKSLIRDRDTPRTSIIRLYDKVTDHLRVSAPKFTPNVDVEHDEEDDDDMLGVINGGNITPRANAHTSPAFSPRSIASTTDGINSNDRNNRVNIMNNFKPYFNGNETALSSTDIDGDVDVDVDIDDDALYNNGFEIEFAEVISIKVVNSNDNVDVIVKHGSIKSRATPTNTNNGNQKININVNIHKSTSINEMENSSCNLKNVNGTNFAKVSLTQATLTDTSEPQTHVLASISMTASVEINNSSPNEGKNANHSTINNSNNNERNHNNGNNMGLPERVHQTGAVSPGTRTQNTFHAYPVAPSNSELRFSRTSLIHEKNIRADDHDSDKKNNNKNNNKGNISSNRKTHSASNTDKIRVLAKNINNINSNKNAETPKKRSSIGNKRNSLTSDKGAFDLEVEIEIDGPNTETILRGAFNKSYSDWDNTIKERLNRYNSKIRVLHVLK